MSLRRIERMGPARASRHAEGAPQGAEVSDLGYSTPR